MIVCDRGAVIGWLSVIGEQSNDMLTLYTLDMKGLTGDEVTPIMDDALKHT